MTAGSVEIEIVETNEPVEAGEFLEVAVEIENASASDVRPALEFAVGGEVLVTRAQTVGAGETERVEFGHQTFPVREDVEFTVAVSSGGQRVERTVRVHGIDGLPDERRSPASELTVRPGTTVLFEVESDVLGTYGGRTRWYLDGAYAGWSMGPNGAAYYAHLGRDYWRHTFESEGTYAVAAALDGDDENRTARWTVTVASDGRSGPSVDVVRPEAGILEVATDETVDLEVDASDADGDLDRVVWWLDHADTVLGVSAVDGAEDTASIAVDARELCDRCPISVWVVTASGAVTSATPWTVRLVERDDRTRVQILETNAPVGAGAELRVHAELENSRAVGTDEDVHLVVGDERVDRETVALEADETETVQLSYETYPVQTNVEFPVTVETADDTDTQTVAVFADEVGPIAVTIRETNDPVLAGEVLEVLAELENTGDSGVATDVHLVAGDRVATESVAIAAGESETVHLDYETYPVRTDVEFPVTVETAGGMDHRTVAVYADALPSTTVTILETNDPVEAGAFLEVVAEIENTGETDETEAVRLVVGSERVDSETVTVGSGASETVHLGYETYPVRQDVDFPVTVETDSALDEHVVEVIGSDGGEDDEDGGDGTEELSVEFENCRRGTVTGEFEAGDRLSASTDFYDGGSFADTIREDSITIGEDVPGPFSGTIVFEVGDERGVSGDADGATVVVADYGSFGTAISGIRTPEASPGRHFDYPNPHDCREEIRPDRPALAVGEVTRIGDGTFDVTFQYENPNDEALAVGSEFDGATTAAPPGELAAGGGSFTVGWTPQSDDERLAWIVDLSDHEYDEPARAETGPANEYDDLEGTLEVSIVGANDPVDAGDVLEVDVVLENTGDADVTQTVALVVGGDRVDSRSVTVGSGGSEAISLGYETHPVEQDVSFAVTVRSDDDAAERTVQVFGPGESEQSEADEEPQEETQETEPTDSPDGPADDGDEAPTEQPADPSEESTDEPGDAADESAGESDDGAEDSTEGSEPVDSTGDEPATAPPDDSTDAGDADESNPAETDNSSEA